MSGYIFSCESCNSENELFRFSCKICGNTFHNKIANIDFTSAFVKLIEAPSSGFREIIQAENKNFIWVILLIASIKILINLHLIFPLQIEATNFSLFQQLVLSFLIIVALSLLLSFAIKNFFAKKYTIRFNDLLAVTAYSQLVYIITLAVFFPLEIVLFGEFLFSRNPSPFFVKETFAYLFSSLELIAIAWQIVLMTIGIKIFVGNKTTAALIAILFLVAVHSILYLFLLLAS